MSNIRYHSVEPTANKEKFGEFDSVDFEISTDRNIVRNSIRIEGKLKVNNTGTTRVQQTEQIHFNHHTGAHGLIDAISTQLGGQIIENIGQSYPHWVHMAQTGSKSNEDYFSSDQICELKASNIPAVMAYAAGKSAKTDQAATFEDVDFSFKPLIAVNRADNDIEMARVGGLMKLTMNLNRNSNFLCGYGNTTAGNYEVRELRVTYRSSDPASVPATNMNSVLTYENILNSNFANLSTRVPAVVQGVSMSFRQTSLADDVKEDALKQDKLPDFRSIQFLFNDSTNTYTQYEVDDLGAALQDYVDSLSKNGLSEVNTVNVMGRQSFGLGLDFGQSISLENNKLSTQIRSGTNSDNPYNMFMAFHSRISA